MKYAVKFSLDTDGFTTWDDDQIEDPDITFSIVRYQSMEEAQRAVNQDFREFQAIGFYSNDTVRSCNGRWLVANDMKMYGGTAVVGEGEAYAVSYEVSGDCDYATMIIESVSPASEEDETHMESDLDEGCIEGVYICEASHCDTEENIHTRNDHKFYITEGLREIFIERVKGAIIKPTSHPEEYSEIDADAFSRNDLEVLTEMANNGDAEASYLLFQIYGSEEMLHDLLFDEYLEKAALGGFPAAIRPYIIRKEFYRFIDADERVRWNKDLPFSFEDYNSYCAKYLQEFLDFCENTVNASPECAEACLELLNAYIREFWGNQWSCDDRARELHKRDDVYETSEFGVLAMKLAQRVSRFPEALLLPLKETYSEQLQKYTDKDSDPFLGGLSLDLCIKNKTYPDLDYLFDRYGDSGIEKAVDGICDIDKEVALWGSEQIKRLSTVSKTCAKEMELCAISGAYGFETEDIFKALHYQSSLGVKYSDSFSYENIEEFISDGMWDIDYAVLNHIKPELLKKYGLEEVTEHIIKALNCEMADDFWKWFDIEQYPNFLNDLVPLLNEHIAKGSVDAANVLIKAFQAGKEGYFADVTHFTVPECVTDIPTDTFGGCKNLIAVALPDGLKRIGPFAFECTGLSSITIPASVNKIGESAFEECESLTDVVLPDGLTEIEDKVFAACTSLSSIKIPAGVNKIGKDAFDSCESLTDVVLPDGLTEIEDGVFAYCTGLSSIKIPTSVNKIGKSAFEGCESLTDVVLPDGLTEIEDDVFACCTGLSSITIPKGVIKIGQRAFMDLLNLIRVILPIGVKTIHADAFEGCDSLQEILVPAHKTDYYKKRLPSELWDKIVELDNSKK